MHTSRFIFAVLILVVANAGSVKPIVVFGTGDPAHNTNAPTGALTNSGWQYSANRGSLMAWPIASNYFAVATHGGVGGPIVVNGTNFNVVNVYLDPLADLAILQTDLSTGTFASIYPREDELGATVMMIGRGTQRGSDENVSCGGATNLVGWFPGAADSIPRWGTNIVTHVEHNVGVGVITTEFRSDIGDDAAQVTSGDSSGAYFINDGGTWKLSCVIHFTSGNPTFTNFCSITKSQSIGTPLNQELPWINWVLTGASGPMPYPWQTVNKTVIKNAVIRAATL